MFDCVNPEFFAAFFFSALRFLVAVSSDLSGCSSVLKALFRQTLETALILAFANPIFHFHRPHPAIKGLLRNTLRDEKTARFRWLAKNGAMRVIALRTRAGRSVRRQSGGTGYQN